MERRRERVRRVLRFPVHLPPACCLLFLAAVKLSSGDLFSLLFGYLSLLFFLPTWRRDFWVLISFFQPLSDFILVILALPGILQGQLYQWPFHAEQSAQRCFSILGYLAAVLALNNLDCTILGWALYCCHIFLGRGRAAIFLQTWEGAAGVLVGHPFDTVKVRLQVQNVEKPLYRGTFHCFQSIIKQESAFGLYKGIGSPMMGLTFINALVFGVQGNTLRALGKDTPLNQFLAGSAAGAIQCIICCPMELAKTRMQLQGTGEYKQKTKNYKNSLDCLIKIYQKEGLRGINRGMVSTFIRETPSFGFYFLTYDCMTRYLGCEAEDSYVIPKLLFSGGMSGIVSWLSTYPMDVIKSRLQADGVGGVTQYKGIMDCVRKSYHEEGWRVFTRGLTSTLLRAFPVNAATFATVTVFLMYMRSDDNIPECEPDLVIHQPSNLQT